MTIIRRLILALALSAGLSPVFAQAPPPVPALPDAERRTSFTLAGTTCACSVGFALYGDSTDYQNWVEVFVNGVRVNFNDSTFGWTITSPTGPLASIPRPVTDAALTFNSVQTGTIQVVGARRPRRTSTFAENRGVAARDLNQILNDMIAQTREVWDKTNDVTGRAIMGIPGEAIIPLPSAALRANSVLCWDATGLIPKACAPLNGQGNVIGPNSAVNGHIAIFSGTTGTILADGGLVGAGNVTGPLSATDGAFALYNGTLGTTIKNGPTIIPLLNGGTASALTASNGGLVYSTGAALAILSGTATANQIAMSGASTTPAWSTATYPATTTANQLLWSSGTNTIAGLTSANNGVLITSAGGVPSISSTLPSAVQANITATGTIATGTWNGNAIAVGFGGTGGTSASGTLLDNITGFSTTGYLKRTGAGTYVLNSPIPLADGGTNASLTASNGGLFYSTGSAAAILSGTGSAGQIPLSGINSAPAWSTSTWPNTVSANSLLWSAGSNAVSGLATGNNGTLITSAGGVPSISSTLPTAVQSNITQLGTIGAGVWNGTAITGSFIGTNTVANSNLAQSSLGATLKGNPSASGANVQDFTIQGLTNKPIPNANNDFIPLFDATTGTIKSVTPGQLVSGTTAGVSSLNGLTGGLSVVGGTGINVTAGGSSVTAALATPVAIANGGTGTTGCLGQIGGLQPLKLGGAVVGVNPGTWCNNQGTAQFSTTSVMTTALNAAVPTFGGPVATGAQVSGALNVTGNTTDGTEVFLYLIHRISDGMVGLVSSSSDIQISSQTFTATAAAPSIFTFASPHGFRKRMAIVFTNSGGSLPSPVAAATQYYICTVPSATTFSIATSIANVNSGTCLTTTTTGSGTNTAKWGVQTELDFQLGAGIAQFDRRVPYFCFVWSWTNYGNAGVPGGTNGIPDFQVAQGASDTILTGATGGSTAAFRALNAGASTTFASVDLSPWLANINRRVLLLADCSFPSSIGACFVRTTGGGSPTGLQVGGPTVATVHDTKAMTFQTDSTTHVDYFVTGGAVLSLYVIGWTFVDPS